MKRELTERNDSSAVGSGIHPTRCDAQPGMQPSAREDAVIRAAVRRELDAQLSFLNERPSQRPEILRRIKGERVVKKKMSLALVFALVAMLAAMTALAAGISFSNKVDVKRAAIDALNEKYGITEEMLTVLHLEVGELDENGAQTVTFTPVERQYAQRVGEYTVTILNGKITASWSHDGEEIGEGIESPVYGAEQLALLCTNYGEVMRYLLDTVGSDDPDEDGPRETPSTPEDYEAYFAAQEAEWASARDAAVAESALSIEECRALAIDAIRSVYGLSDEQIAKLETFDDQDGMLFDTVDGHHVISVMYWLWQGADEHTEKDGQYWVDVNMDTGVIEDVLYDSAMAGNG